MIHRLKRMHCFTKTNYILLFFTGIKRSYVCHSDIDAKLRAVALKNFRFRTSMSFDSRKLETGY